LKLKVGKVVEDYDNIKFVIKEIYLNSMTTEEYAN